MCTNFTSYQYFSFHTKTNNVSTRRAVPKKLRFSVQENPESAVPSVRACVHPPLRQSRGHWRGQSNLYYYFNEILANNELLAISCMYDASAISFVCINVEISY